MANYKDGQEIKLNDLVSGEGMNANRVIAGTIVSLPIENMRGPMIVYINEYPLESITATRSQKGFHMGPVSCMAFREANEPPRFFSVVCDYLSLESLTLLARQ